ncbi:MAG: hypothetical protein HQK51_20520, partial [Oligoflexia bacterium]|nr:hypothetical protein [Oligoflexia bacterium]
MRKKILNKRINKQSKQSDIVIDLDGNISISFLWDDFIYQDVKKCQIEQAGHAVQADTTYQKDINSNNLINSQTEKKIIDQYTNCDFCPKECAIDRTIHTHPSCGNSKLKVSNFGISYGEEEFLTGIKKNELQQLLDNKFTKINYSNLVHVFKK